jgi:hypothetical protein
MKVPLPGLRHENVTVALDSKIWSPVVKSKLTS